MVKYMVYIEKRSIPLILVEKIIIFPTRLNLKRRKDR